MEYKNDIPATVVQSDFEELYIALRKKEQRIYTNRQVALLPEIDNDHIYFKEWELRKKSTAKLIRYIQSKKRPVKILEIGCGNGWLSNKMAEENHTQVIGIDINSLELKQAKEVFKNKSNLSFVKGSIENAVSGHCDFDLIVFAASIQYFPSISKVAGFAQSLLNNRGEIHILDSPFYEPKEINEAKERSRAYYSCLGFEKARLFYHHHQLNELNNFKIKILYNPLSFFNKLNIRRNPFYWICIKK